MSSDDDNLKYLEKWVDAHDELELDAREVLYDGKHLTYVSSTNDRISLGPEDGGVRGRIVGYNEDSEALIINGSQVAYVGEDAMQNYDRENRLYDGMVEFTGRFAVWPMGPHQVEVDGPLPEDD